jgi:hypothetical protein
MIRLLQQPKMHVLVLLQHQIQKQLANVPNSMSCWMRGDRKEIALHRTKTITASR